MRRRLPLFVCVLLASACSPGCASDDGPRPIEPAVDLHSPSGTRRAQAVQLVAAEGARDHVPTLIELLDDRDATVRMQAHAALQEMTGHDTGYRPFEGRTARAAHVARWQAWWRDQQAQVAPATDGADGG